MENKQLIGIEFRLTIRGEGAVNNNEQDLAKADIKAMLASVKKTMKNGDSECDIPDYDGMDMGNHTFHKARLYRDSRGVLHRTPIMSRNSIRHWLYEEEMPYMLPELQRTLVKPGGTHSDVDPVKELRVHYCASKEALVRGYMIANKGCTYKRASSLYIDDASVVPDEDSNTAEFNVALCTSSAKKKENTKKGDDDTSDTSMFRAESFSKAKLVAEGYLDLQDIGFISLDNRFDRLAFFDDQGVYLKKYRDALKKSLKCSDDIPEPQHYARVANSIYVEFGIQLTDDQIKCLIKDTFTRLYNFRLTKRTGSLRVSSVEFRPVYKGEFAIDYQYGNIPWTFTNSKADYDTILIPFIDGAELYHKYEPSDNRLLADVEQHVATQEKIKKDSDDACKSIDKKKTEHTKTKKELQQALLEDNEE